MNKQTILLLLAGLLLIALPCAVAAEDARDNLLMNAGFEETADGEPGSWSRDVWIQDGSVSRLDVVDGAGRSGAAARIENKLPNDAKWVQNVPVEPGALYKLSGWVKAENADLAAKGANLSVLGVTETSDDVKDTAGEWRYLELYGKTGNEQREVTVAVRLGGYGSLTTGVAYFDDIRFERVESAPSGAKVIDFSPAAAPANTDLPDKAPASALPLVFFSLLFTVLFLYLYFGWIRGEPPQRLSPGAARVALVAALAAGLALRLWIAGESEGYANDIATFKAWAYQAAEVGLTQFYNSDMFVDYPPGHIYVLYIIGLSAKWFALDYQSTAMLVLIKLPAIIADLAIGGLLYRFGRRRLGQTAAFALALLWLFNPAVLVDSAAWGQVDSFFALAVGLVLIALINGRLGIASALFAVAVLIKPQALMYTPVLMLAFIAAGSVRRFGFGVLSGLAAFVLLILPFTVRNEAGPLWIAELYKDTLASYPYATLNAFNLYALVGANWAPVDGTFLFLSYQTWGTLFIVLTVFAAAYLFFRRKTSDPSIYAFLALLIVTAVFMLSAKMHERYWFPALLFALLVFARTKDRRILLLFFGISLTQFINVGYVLANTMSGMHIIGKVDGVLLMTSLVNMLLFVYLLKVGFDIYVRRAERPIAETEAPEATARRLAEWEEAEDKRAAAGRMSRKDWIWCGALTAAYAVLALINLGAASAPETAWKAERSGETIVFDLGEMQTVERVNLFSGIGNGKLRLEFSTDPAAFEQENAVWSHPATVEFGYTKVFAWTSLKVEAPARYAKLTVEQAGFTLNELAFFAKDRDEPLPVTIRFVSSGAGTGGAADSPAAEAGRQPVMRIIDEQDRVPAKPTFMHGTYFDEIYHARTAFEHLEGIKPYETTHPPLGKLLISLGIAVFGMNPFGWRIVGTLIGVAMIPVIYRFAKRMFGRSEYALLAGFLLTFDFMHFAQTRIATIDVYGVFFIMLMYDFMYRYFTMSFYRVPLKKTLVPLFWSGLFFGIGAASKWIVIYGGAGLALLFFLSLFERYRQFKAAKAILAAPADKQQDAAFIERQRHIVRVFRPYAFATLAWCTLFFVLIPAVIYSASFLPYMAVPGEGYSLSNLWKYQLDMYNYHSQLIATHPFSSQWWEWPFMYKPIWYYSGQALLPDGLVSSIVSMGNPAVWWPGAFAVLLSVWLCAKHRHRGLFVALVAYGSQYLPWVLVSRLTFIYHYFAMVPFMILCIVYVIQRFGESADIRPGVRRSAAAVYAAVVFILFAMFYPILSGMVVDKAYVAHFLRWFDSWYFYS